MPELPHLQVLKRYVDSTVLHQTIEDLETRDADYILEGIDQDDLADTLVGRAFDRCVQHGKLLFLGDGDDAWLVLHFGMTGDLEYFKGDEANQPEFTKLRLDFDNGYHLAYVNVRKLGEINLTASPEAYLEAHDIGPDPTDESFDWETFRELIGQKRGYLKSAIRDQSLMAGVGNILSDEILWQCRLHPQIEVSDASEDDLECVFEQIERVNDAFVEHWDEMDEALADSFLRPHREEGGRCPRCETELERVDVSGRNAYFCPNCQA